jgi:hypothetical protein
MVGKVVTALNWACFIGTVLIAAECGAQAEDVDPFHWAYAAALGAGVYRLGDGTEAQTYRGNFSVALRKSQQDRSSLRLLLPVAFGLQNLDEDDLPVDRPSDKIEHAAVLPGIELEHRVGRRWTLRTRGQVGRAEELQGTKQSARIAAVGLRGRVELNGLAGNPALISGILWTGFEPRGGERRSLLRLTAGVELDVPAARWRVRDGAMGWRPHVLTDWYYRPPGERAFGDDGFERVDREWQIGVAAARDNGFKIAFFRFEAVGVAYRFSEHSSGLRFYLNSVF